MDINQIVQSVIAVLIPALPHLTKIGETLEDEAIRKIGSKLGKKSLDRIKRIWPLLRPKSNNSQSIQETIQNLSRVPDDPDYREMFRLQIKKMIEEDSDLADSLQQVLMPGSSHVTQKAGDGAFQIGGDNNGPIVIINKKK